MFRQSSFSNFHLNRRRYEVRAKSRVCGASRFTIIKVKSWMRKRRLVKLPVHRRRRAKRKSSSHIIEPSQPKHCKICESLGVQFPRATRLYLKIDGRMVHPWRAVEAEGEVLDVLVQTRRNRRECMQQPIILSTSSAISPQQERTEPTGHRPCRHGVKSSLLREPDVPGDLLRAIFGNVTEPADQLAYFERDLWPAAATSRLPSPEQTKTSTIPTDDSRWLNDHQGIHQLPRIARSTFKFPSPLRFARRMAAFNSPPKIKMEAIM